MSVCTFVWAEDGVTWYCTLDNGHDGVHGAGTLGDEILRWCPRDDAAPRTWSLPPVPGPEVTAVVCKCHGIRYDRTDRITAAREPLWQAEHHEPGFGWPTWRDLLANHDKLTDATETGADHA